MKPDPDNISKYGTHDNNYSKPLHVTDARDLDNFRSLAGRSIRELSNENKELLVFPDALGLGAGEDEDATVFNLESCPDGSGLLVTGNTAGFIGIRKNGHLTELSIHSRFTDNDDDFFLHYMLQRVFLINVFHLEHSFSREDPVFDFLKFLFPRMLSEALRQGLYKEYVTKRHDEPVIHGSIDVPSFMMHDVPFMGNISSVSREHSYDNDMTQLVRHTIEVLRRDPVGKSILEGSREAALDVAVIERATPTFSPGACMRVVSSCMRKKPHPYFTSYDPLRRLCLQIIRHEGIRYLSEENEDRVFGVLFDVSWLWEEYLGTLLCGFEVDHPENRKGKGGIQLFIDSNGYTRYPDFLSRKMSLVMDAKYKRLGPGASFGREDIHQMVTYMYMLRAKRGIFLYPDISETEIRRIGTLGDGDVGGYPGVVEACSLRIPGSTMKYKDFLRSISKEEKDFITKLSIGL